MRSNGWVALFLFWLLSTTAVAGGDAGVVQQLLEKMASASQFLNYTGTFTFVNGSKSWTMKIVHSFDKHGEREYLKTVAGDDREVYRDDHSLISVSGANELVLVESTSIGTHPASKAFDRDFSTESKSYDYYLDGTENIAGYTCQVVSIVPRDQYRFGYRLCLETVSGLLLKSQVVDKSGQPKEQLVFKKLEFPAAISGDDFKPSTYNKQLEAVTQPPEPQEDSFNMLSRWDLNDLPPGFSVVQDTTRNISGSASAVRHIILDDGIAAVSIFIKRPANGEKYHASKQASGALNTLMKIRQGFVVTVIGEVPDTTISAVYAALKLV